MKNPFSVQPSAPSWRRLALAVASVACASALLAREGMWMPQQVPQFGAQLKEMGLQIDPAAFADLTSFPMGAVVSLGGCSASFVSSSGLIATNHHCVEGALQYNSTAERDLITNGFLARKPAEEIPATPDARVYVAQSIDDVTSLILAPFPDRTDDADRGRGIERRRKQMIRDGEKKGGVRVQVVPFLEGSRYLRIVSMEIRDVRLVYAPALSVGNFGDEVDNWIWPRHTGDFGFYRAYVGRDGRPAPFSPENVPYQPKHWLRISTRDVDPGDLMIVTGYPGRTERLQTAAETYDAQSFDIPASIRYREKLLEVLQAMGPDDRSVAIANTSRISSLENFLKKHRGALEALVRTGAVEKKKQEEAELASYFGRTPEGTKQYEAIRAELDRIRQLKNATRERDTLLSWLYTASPMLSQANTLCRWSVERTKQDLDRSEGYQKRDEAKIRGSIRRAQRSIEPGSDRAGLRLFLLEATRLPDGQRLDALDEALASTGKPAGEGQVDALLDRLYANTRMANLEERQKMFAESPGQLRERHDPMIDLAAELMKVGDANRDREAAVSGAKSRVAPALAGAMRAIRGERLYPDANGTLRVSFGRVEGYTPRDAVSYDPQTDIAGVVEKNSGKSPFNSPEPLLQRAATGDYGTYADPDLHGHGGILPVDFLTTNDITNGNSGSATLNAWGELAGLAFDGNIESMASDYVYDAPVNRTISVDIRYVLWVMDAVDGAHNLLREMGLEPQFE